MEESEDAIKPHFIRFVSTTATDSGSQDVPAPCYGAHLPCAHSSAPPPATPKLLLDFKVDTIHDFPAFEVEIAAHLSNI